MKTSLGSLLPQPNRGEGWIFHPGWDGRFEGAWADPIPLPFRWIESKGSRRTLSALWSIPSAGGVRTGHGWRGSASPRASKALKGA